MPPKPLGEEPQLATFVQDPSNPYGNERTDGAAFGTEDDELEPEEPATYEEEPVVDPAEASEPQR